MTPVPGRAQRIVEYEKFMELPVMEGLDALLLLSILVNVDVPTKGFGGGEAMTTSSTTPSL
jgi:hypothetical protein